MEVRKVRFIEPGNPPYKRSIQNLYTYEKYIRTPAHGLLTLTTIVKTQVDDTFMYSESISKIKWDDVLDADIIFIGMFTFAANRGYELAKYIKANSNALVVLGGQHPSMNYSEAVRHCDFVLLGEGDESILEFIAALRANTTPKLPGLAYLRDGEIVHTGERTPPQDINTIPDRYLLYNYHKMAGHFTLWPQVHASRGCPHDCDYCAMVKHFGHRVRTRLPQNVVEDIAQAIEFQNSRLIKNPLGILWITDDNFFADLNWAKQVLRAMIAAKFNYRFTIQARYEVGLDDELLDLLKAAGFAELALGIEFLEDESFVALGKRSYYAEIIEAVHNIQKHGMNTRGLFIIGADTHTKGVGTRLAEFVDKHNIRGVLIQGMYFIPGTKVYEDNKDRLLHQDWSKYCGHVVHHPRHLSAFEMQREIITASAKIYSFKHTIKALITRKWADKLLYLGELFWQRSVRKNLKRELKNLPREMPQQTV